MTSSVGTVAASGRRGAVTSAEIRAAMFGHPAPGITVVRQGWRISATDSDELALIDARGQWWVAQRVSDRITVWAYAGDVEAADGFDRMLDRARARGQEWHEAVAQAS